MNRNRFLLFSNLVYQIYNTPDFKDMKRIYLEQLSMLIPNTCASLLTAKMLGSKLSLINPVCYPPEYEELEKTYLSMDKQSWIRWSRYSEQPMLFRETDMLSEEERLNTLVYQKCYEPFGVHYVLQQTLVYDNHYLGAVSLYRKREEGDFTDIEMLLMQELGTHLSLVFFHHRDFMQNIAGVHPPLMDFAKQRGLTGRETEVLTLIFEKLSNIEICSKLHISAHTLKKHTQNIYRKLNVSSRWELLKFNLL